MAKWLLIDGFNLAYRCFFAIPELARADGFPTNALHGWIKSLWKLDDQERPHATLVFFDLGGAHDKIALHPEYKSQRPDMPEALERQLEPLKKLTRAMGHIGIEQHGVESDDLLASQAIALTQAGHDVLIVSSDKDFAQLVGDHIKIMLPPPSANPKLGWRLLDAAGVKEKFGVPPAQIPDYLALVGDTSDNIDGIDGVGPKTAARWLADWKNLEGVIAHAADLNPERFRSAVAGNADRLRRNLRLTTLVLTHPTVAAEKTPLMLAELLEFLELMEMRSTLVEAQTRYGQPELF